uniref:K Homology domain-containing protein n=1 Tax=Quercus lobata TaxID=97700 RepID=A0A7N2L3B0_QUELO
MKAGEVIGKFGSIIKLIRQHIGAWINVHKLIPKDEEQITEISNTRRRMDYCEKGFGVEWGEECREFLMGGRFWPQPRLDPLRLGGRRKDLQPTADHHGSSRIGLRKAIGWVAQVFQDETRHSIPPESVFEGSDLSPTGGGFRFGRDGSILVGLVGFVRAFNVEGEDIPFQEASSHRFDPFPRFYPFQSGSYKTLPHLSIPSRVDEVLESDTLLRVGIISQSGLNNLH